MSHERGHFVGPRPYVDEIAAAGIVIDADGCRFADEGLGGIYLSNIVARLSDPLGATIVFDQAIWDGPPGCGYAQLPNPLLLEAGGTLHRAGTIAELAGLVGIAPQRLEELVRAYNAAIDAGTLHMLSPPRRSDRYRAWRSGPRRSTPYRSARPLRTPWAASWSTAMAPSSTRATRRCRACSRQDPPSEGWTADRTLVTSAD